MGDPDLSSGDEQFVRPSLSGSTSRAYDDPHLRPSSPSSSDSQLSSASEDFQDSKSGFPSTFGGAKARVRKRRRVMSRSSTQQPAKQKTTDPGEWERHTRGIGSKILAKHGFTGRLGKRADGIAAPIQAVFRPEKLGLGAGGFSEKGNAVEVEEAVEKRDRETSYIKRRRKKGFEFEHPEHFPPQDAFDKVIDMREALPREVDSVAKLLQPAQKAKEPENPDIDDHLFAAPEVLYNLQMLTDNARAEVGRAKRMRDTENLIIQTAEREAAKAQAGKEEAKQALVYIAELKSLFDRLTHSHEVDDADVFEDCVKGVVGIWATGKEKNFVCTQVVLAALTEVVSERVEKQLERCLIQSFEKGKADRRLARHIYRVLVATRKALDPVAYTKLCTRAILTPLRQHMSRPAWDVVRGACVGDILSSLRRILPEALLKIFAEDVLVPKLLSRLQTHGSSSLAEVGKVEVPAHVWIHPWLPATGRKPLVEVIHHVRVSLSKSLQKWEPGGSAETRAELVALVKNWSGVLSHRKLQLALSRHVAPKLGYSLTRVARPATHEYDVEHTLGDVAAWAEVGSMRLLAKELMVPFLSGLGAILRSAAFADGGWVKAKEMYLSWTKHLPERFKEYMQPALAVLLFVLHAARVTTESSTRRRLLRADLKPLLRNRFERPMLAEPEKETAQGGDIGRGDEGRKARLADVVELVGQREGLAVVGLGEERGMRVFQVGVARVVADVEKNVFVVGGRIVDVEEMVRHAKGG